jgi:cell division protein FtsL
MSSSFTHTGQKLQNLEQQKTTLQAQIYDLEAEISALASLDRVQRAATERFGMVPARTHDYISVNVEAPSGPLLPRPILQLTPEPATQDESWWQALIKALPLP